MKMFNVNTRAIASFVLAIFLTTLSVVLIAWACDSLKDAVERRKEDVTDAKAKVKSIEEKGVLNSISKGAVKGAVISGSSGLAIGWKAGVSTAPLTKGISVPAGIIGGVSIGIVGGGIGGGVGGAFSYYDDLSAANDNLDYYERQLAEAKEKLEICLNPPAKYTYTEPSSGYVWEFCETMYGSDEAAKAAYLKFLEKRGH